MPKHKIPESMGIIVGVVYLVCMFVFIPVPFMFNGYVKKMLEGNLCVPICGEKSNI